MGNVDFLNVVKSLTKLLKEFSSHTSVTPMEFIDKKYGVDFYVNQFEQELYNNFLLLMKHEDFLNASVDIFWHYYQLKPYNRELVSILFYIVIFILNDNNGKEISNMFITLHFKLAINILDYILIEDNVVDLTQAACKIYDNDYVLHNVVEPILRNTEVIEDVRRKVNEELKKNNAIEVKPVTIPVTPTCCKRSRIPVPPPNSLEDLRQSRPAVKVKQRSHKTQNSIEKYHQENREKAAKLLEFARRNAFKCANISPKNHQTHNPQPFVIKHKRIPLKKDVAIKGNTASLMREAAVLAKDRVSEMQKIEALMQGGFDPSTLEALEEEIRLCKQQQYLQDIERKHLQGMLTYEESKSAKQNLLKENQAKIEEFKKERLTILEEIEEWKEREQEKIKTLVAKCQNIEKAARDAEIKMQQNKKIHARMVEIETKNILSAAYEERQRELAQKVQLIQELRAAQQVRSLQVKEFDPTESPNFGLLCEMSIAELQERLGLLKIQLQEELDKRKEIIVLNKKKQQEMIEGIKQFVAENKTSKPKRAPKPTCKLNWTPDLIALRERLQLARENNSVRIQQT